MVNRIVKGWFRLQKYVLGYIGTVSGNYMAQQTTLHSPDEFDYIIIEEVDHVEAKTYLLKIKEKEEKSPVFLM